MASIDDPDDGSGAAVGGDAAPSPYGDLAAKRMLETVQATLAKLPASQREAFILVRFEGLSMAEAAQVLDTTEASAKIRAFRAYEALRAALGEGAR
jgi:RNA polymerase sigma-70 factor (ECF subfamily)